MTLIEFEVSVSNLNTVKYINYSDLFPLMLCNNSDVARLVKVHFHSGNITYTWSYAA